MSSDTSDDDCSDQGDVDVFGAGFDVEVTRENISSWSHLEIWSCNTL